MGVEVFLTGYVQEDPGYASKGGSKNGGYVAGRKLTTDSYAMDEGHANGGVFASPRSSPRSSSPSLRPGSTLKPLQ